MIDLNILTVFVLCVSGIWLIFSYFIDNSIHRILESMSDELTGNPEEEAYSKGRVASSKGGGTGKSEVEIKERAFGYKEWAIFIVVTTGLLTTIIVFIKPSPARLPVFAIMSFGVGYLIARSGINRELKEAEDRNELIDFYLPVVMERIVMAVQSGMDILPAVKVACELEIEESQRSGKSLDPVTEILMEAYRKTENGLTVERAFKDVMEEQSSIGLRHAMIHLSQAHKEGGAILGPLRELANSTQKMYEELVEEDIAKLPVKATLPLVISFGGLLICLMTAPIIQVLEFISSRSL